MAAINSETPAVAITTMAGSNLTDQITTFLGRGSVPAIAARTKQTAADTATLTATQVLGGYIQVTPTAASSLTLPTAALLVAGLKSIKTPAVGDTLDCMVVNTSAGAFAITVLAGSSGTVRGSAPTIAQNKSGRIFFYLTNVTASTEAYDYIVSLTA